MNIPIQLIKLGGSIITDKQIPYSARVNTIRSLVRVLKKSPLPLLISHGSGSFGHTSATVYGGKKGYESSWGLAKVARDAMEINKIIMDIFIEEKLPAISFRPLSCMLAHDGILSSSFFDPIHEALLQKFIPVLYGDVIFDTVWKSTIFSGETIFSYLIPYLRKKNYTIRSIIQVSNTNGIQDAKGNIIPIINSTNWNQIRPHIFPPHAPDVTGGMKHKIRTALKIAELGIKTIIIDGSNPNNLLQTLQGYSLGTEIS